MRAQADVNRITARLGQIHTEEIAMMSGDIAAVKPRLDELMAERERLTEQLAKIAQDDIDARYDANEHRLRELRAVSEQLPHDLPQRGVLETLLDDANLSAWEGRENVERNRQNGPEGDLD